MISKASITQKLRAFTGPLTRELVQSPAHFGLGRVPSRLAPDATATTVCGFCSTGCSLKVHLIDGAAVNLTADVDYPVNLAMASPKGWEALTPLASPGRATTPLYRSTRSGELEPVDWTRAAQTFCERIRAVQKKHGPESVAFLSTGQICTEEMAYLGAFAKFGMGMLHGDGNTRQCMATSVAAYKESFGFDAPPYTYEDFEESDVLVFIGANPCIAHPIMWQRVLRNPHDPEIIVIDPRVTETASAATLHLPLAPKSDLALLYGIARLLIKAGAIDRTYIDNHTDGFEAFSAHVDNFTPATVSNLTGLPAAQLEHTANLIAGGKRVSFWWAMGVNQGHEATRTAQAIINLALMTGNIGRSGTGANSITGQCNAMGSRLFSNTTNLLGGHDFTNSAHRDKVAGVLGIDPEKIPDRGSLAYDQIIDGIESGSIRALWIIATNGAHSWTHSDRFAKLLAKLDFLVVQDIYADTETARLADLVLPAAGWGEKEGTFINSERRLGVTRKIARAPGDALADFAIFKLLAHYWGTGGMFDRWQTPEDVFEILKELSRDQPCDITGIRDYAMLDEAGGIQWPLPEGALPALPHRRLFADGRFFTPDERARFKFADPIPLPEPTDETYPFTLLTGRGTSAQWHTQTRTGRSAVLRKLYPKDLYAEIHPEDAAALGIKANAAVTITSRRGAATATAFLTATVGRGRIFLPMHYPETNRLTHQVVDPHSRQPDYKHCAVNLAPVNSP